MPERVLPNDLSGEEIRAIVCDALNQKLAKDCHLQGTKAYGSFRAEISWKVWATDSGREIENSGSLVAQVGEDPEDGAEGMVGSAEINPAPPTEMRVNHGLPVPVLAKSSNGDQEIREVKYSRKAIRKPA